LHVFTIAPTQIDPHYNAWVKFENDMQAKGKTLGMSAMTQSSSTWVFMHTQAVYVSSALSGGGVSLALAFFVLVISTGNIYIAVFATSSLVFVVCSLLGLIVCFGWELGTIESICATVHINTHEHTRAHTYKHTHTHTCSHTHTHTHTHVFTHSHTCSHTSGAGRSLDRLCRSPRE
jgi:ABC-type nickel/cobalt efflux system permease component RcnA